MILLFQDQAAGAAPISGTLSRTLGALALAATATVAIAGQSAPTCGPAVAAGTARVEVRATSSTPLGVVSAAGTAGVEVRGTSARTLDPAGSVGTAGIEIRGQAAATLSPLLAAASAEGPAVPPITEGGVVGGGGTWLPHAKRDDPVPVAVVRARLATQLASATAQGHAVVGTSGRVDVALTAATSVGHGTVAWEPPAPLVDLSLTGAGTVRTNATLVAELSPATLEARAGLRINPRFADPDDEDDELTLALEEGWL